MLPVTAKASVWPASSAGPAEIAVAQFATDCAGAFWSTLWSAPFTKEGASLTAATAIVKVCAALVSTPPSATPPLSCARTVTVALPFAFGAGV